MIFKRIVLPVLAIAALSAPARAARTTPGCDLDRLAEVKQEFLRLRNLHREQPRQIDEGELRQASIQYVGLAEDCYRAMSGRQTPTGQIIDNGGVWYGSFDPGDVRQSRQPDRPVYRKHNLAGTKWGSGTNFQTCCDNPDAQGPRLPGGTVTYSLMMDGVDLSGDCGAGCTNTAVTSLPTFESCFLREISDAFGAWSAVADIQFVPVTDGGAPFDFGFYGDIRIGAHPFDGASGVLAHAYFPPPNGTGAAGDLHLDLAEDWGCDATLGAIDLGIVLLHELGHSLGLTHEGSDPAVMEPVYNPALTFGPLADDILGIGEIYGGSPVGKSFFFGDVGIGTDAPQASLHVLRSDGTSLVRVQETRSPPASRTLFQLMNNGGAFFSLRNTSVGSTWSFSVSSVGSFQIDNPAVGGGAEAVFFNSGAVRMGAGGVQRFLLDPAGNLTIAGDLTARGIFYPSDRELKENVVPVDVAQVLKELTELPISSWNYRSDPAGARHIGPMAQDFREHLSVGSDGHRINAMDAAGVTLAAIQGLHRMLLEKEKELEILRRDSAAQLETLRAGMAAQQAELQTLRALLAEIQTLLANRTGIAERD